MSHAINLHLLCIAPIPGKASVGALLVVCITSVKENITQQQLSMSK
jgi:hypothetical protein